MLEAEQHVIGSLLMDQDSMKDIYNFLTDEMFTSFLYGKIFKQFEIAFDNGYKATNVSIIQNLQSEILSQSDIQKAIIDCVAIVNTSAGIRAYAQVVRNDYLVRKTEDIYRKIGLNAADINNQLAILISEFESMLENKDRNVHTLKEIAQQNKSNYFCETKKFTDINTGFGLLDDMLGDLEGGDVTVIGARPAVGKSAFVAQIISNVAKKGKKIAFYNLEMEEKQIYERFLAAESGINLTRIKRATTFWNGEETKFEYANRVIENFDNVYIYSGQKTVSEMRAETRHMDFDLIVIDYLQLLKSESNYRGNRQAEVGQISKSIKALSMELNIPIILLSQLNRSSEGRETREPTMSELREAGDIEQDASNIILIWNKNEERTEKGVKVDKNRQGTTGKLEMYFDGKHMKFTEKGEFVQEEISIENNNPFL